MSDYAVFLREKIVGAKPDDIVGNPIGRDALLNELAHELIPYTPEELLEIADGEYANCKLEMKKAAGELGFGDDWKAALEHMKTLHVAPGEQATVVRDLALDALEFVESRGLVTVPPLARECRRMEMMSAERQKVNPFFIGGEVIAISYSSGDFTTRTTTGDAPLRWICGRFYPLGIAEIMPRTNAMP